MFRQVAPNIELYEIKQTYMVTCSESGVKYLFSLLKFHVYKI